MIPPSGSLFHESFNSSSRIPPSSMIPLPGSLFHDSFFTFSSSFLLHDASVIPPPARCCLGSRARVMFGIFERHQVASRSMSQKHWKQCVPKIQVGVCLRNCGSKFGSQMSRLSHYARRPEVGTRASPRQCRCISCSAYTQSAHHRAHQLCIMPHCDPSA